MLPLPANMPDALNEVIDVAKRLGGECTVFTPHDRLIYGSAEFMHKYSFLDFSNATYDDLFWGSVKRGYFGVDEMRMKPKDYLLMAKAARLANDQLDFNKKYKRYNMIGHHRAVNGWSVQVRLSPNNPLWRGGFAGVVPKSLAEAVGAAEATRHMRQAFDALSTGVLFLTDGGEVLWSNAAGLHALGELRGVTIKDDWLTFDSKVLKKDFETALADVTGGAALRKFIALPTRKGGALMGSLAPHLNGEALLVLAPQLNNDLLRAAMLGYGLSPAECEVALLSAEGLGTSGVADATGKSINTVRVQLGAVQRKFAEIGRSSRTGAVGLTMGLSAVAGVKPGKN